MERIISPKDYREQMWEKHKIPLDLWRKTHKLIEHAIYRKRERNSPFEYVIDAYFIEIFKTFRSIYIIAISGYMEDCAAALGRMTEHFIELRYLLSNENTEERDKKARKFSAYFWAINGGIKSSAVHKAPEADVLFFKTNYEENLNTIYDVSGELYDHWWGNETHEAIAAKLGITSVYENYKTYSRILHTSPEVMLACTRYKNLEIRTDEFFEEIISLCTIYMLSTAKRWNEIFNRISAEAINSLFMEANS